MEKLKAVEQLVQEQLEIGHVEQTTTPWDTPIFAIKKKLGKWMLLQDLRTINKAMEDMGTLQPGLPSPVAVPKGYCVIVRELRLLFTIKLNLSDCYQFAFNIPSPNLKRWYQRYHWKVLPQGMKNSPTMC